jgi:glycosyltransferase involved in cell wall biosynthesis
MTAFDGKTIAVIFHNIGPYHHARLNAAASLYSVAGIEWSARQTIAWGESATPPLYRKVSLFPATEGAVWTNRILYAALEGQLREIRPDVLAVNGWNDFGSMVSVACGVELGIPLVVMSESSRYDGRRVWWKESVKRRIVAFYSAALVGGGRHKGYLSDLGMPLDRVFMGYDVVDNRYFEDKVAEVRSQKSEVRKKYGLPEKFFLASARFIPKKNLDTLIRAYAAYRERSAVSSQQSEGSELRSPTSDLRPPTSDPWSLVILGDGPLRSDLRSLISDLRLQDFVLLPGFKQYGELPTYYALASAFVHASSSEQWGLVVNEAMASGLPVIVSERCGCAPELVRESVNGFTFDPSDQAQLASRLTAMSALSLEERARMGQASHEIVQQFGPDKFGEGLERAAGCALSVGPKYPGLIDRLVIKRVLAR